MGSWTETVFTALNNVLSDIVGVLPSLLGALSLILIGWILASLVRRFVSKLLDRLGFNSIVEKAGISDFLHNAGFLKPASWVVGQLIFYMLMLLFILSAAESLQLNALAETLQKFVAFMPNLITVVFILVFGVMLARFIGGMVQGAAAEAGIDFANVIGALVTNIIVFAIIVVSVTQLEIESDVLNILFASLLGAFGLAIALTLGFGARDVARNIIAGVYARKLFQGGQRLRVGGAEGEILEVGTVSTVVRTAKGRCTIPNALLIDQIAEVEDK